MWNFQPLFVYTLKITFRKDRQGKSDEKVINGYFMPERDVCGIRFDTRAKQKK